MKLSVTLAFDQAMPFVMQITSVETMRMTEQTLPKIIEHVGSLQE